MSRTNRKYMTESNYREARKGKATAARENAIADALPVGAWEVPAAQRLTPEWATYRPSGRGGMLMSSRSTGLWSDEIDTDRGVHRRREQRSAQAIAAEAFVPDDATDSVWSDMRAVDAIDPTPVFDITDEVGYPFDESDELPCCRSFRCVCHMIEGEDY
jgi:hypothetical protein